MSADELVDVVDEHDQLIGQATRREVRQQNLWHRCVYILVFNPAGQLFVHQRTVTKDVFPGFWDVTVGGVLNAGEDYDAGARRELHEELGIAVTGLRRLFSTVYQDEASRVVGMVYSCTCDQPVQLQESEIARGEWLDLDVVVERLSAAQFCPDGLQVLGQYLSKLEAARNRR